MSIKNLYSTSFPSLGVDFASTKRIPPEMQFSRASTGTYIGSDGLIKTAAINEPRFDHDPLTGKIRGLLVEESRTNLITYSQQINSSFYTNGYSGGSLIGNTTETLAPDGTYTASKCIANNGATNVWWGKYGIQGISVISGTSYTISCFFKPAEFNTINFIGDIRDGGGLDFGGAFTLTGNGVASGSGGTFQYAFIQPLPNGWYKCSVTGTSNATTTEEPGFALFNISGNGVSGIYAWGFQMETGASPTSYIPTTTTAVTRAADTLTVPTSKFLNPSGGSILVETETLGNNSPAFSLNDGTAFNEAKVLVYPTAGGARLVTSDIVINGLVLNLDAANPASYPGTGTTWTDLSGNGNTGTLVNGVGYNSGNLGSLVFDGVDDYVNIPTTTALNLGIGDWSIDVWFFLPSIYASNNLYASIFETNQFFIGTLRSGLTGIPGFYTVGTNSMFTSSPFGSYTYGGFSYNCAGKWTNLSIVKNGATTYCYLNGSLYASKSSNTYTNQSNFGRYGLSLANAEGFNGNIPLSKIYNRALTAAEVTQNFSALRGRYGI